VPGGHNVETCNKIQLSHTTYWNAAGAFLRLAACGAHNSQPSKKRQRSAKRRSRKREIPAGEGALFDLSNGGNTTTRRSVEWVCPRDVPKGEVQQWQAK
jgi:hypothetical protein